MRPLRPHSHANATANATGTPFTRKRITTIAAAATAVAIIIAMFPLGSAAEEMWDGDAWHMAAELGVTMQVLTDYRLILAERNIQ